MSLIKEVYHKQDSRLYNMPNEDKKITLSSFVLNFLAQELEFVSAKTIDKDMEVKVLGLHVEVVESNDIFISISAK